MNKNKMAMIGMLVGIVINIILNPIFIFSLHMGIRGSALASVIGNVVSVAWFIYYLQMKSNVQSVSIKDFKPSKEIYYNIFKVGASAFLLDGRAYPVSRNLEKQPTEYAMVTMRKTITLAITDLQDNVIGSD